MDSEAYFLTVLRYILQNPIKAGLEKHMGEYPYSSFGAYEGNPDGLTDTDFAFGYFEDRNRLVEFLKAASRDKALDVDPPKSRVSDADVSSRVNEFVGEAGKASFAELEKPLQRDCVQRMLQQGATIRQVAAATGLPKSNVARMGRE